MCPLVIKGSKVLQEHATQTKLPVEPNASDLDEHFFKNFSTLIAMLAVHESSSLRKLLECRIPSTSEVVAAFPDFEKHDVLEVFSSVRWEGDEE